MRISDFIAQIITQRRALVWSSVAVLALGCIATLVTQLRLDSDVLNILPASFRSVAGLKIYDREFEQTRQLTFALVCAPADVEAGRICAGVRRQIAAAILVHARTRGLADADARWNPRSPIDRGAVALEPGTGRFQ